MDVSLQVFSYEAISEARHQKYFHGNVSWNEDLFLVVAPGEVILGMQENGFIGLANCSEWVKNGKVSSTDFILTCLAMVRITQQWVTLFDSFLVGLSPHPYAIGEQIAKAVTILWALITELPGLPPA